MAHPAMAFDNGIIPVGFHFFRYIRVNEFRHTGLPPLLLYVLLQFSWRRGSRDSRFCFRKSLSELSPFRVL
jgi:hypothetical protein